MTDIDNLTDTARAAETLNHTSQPLGWAVTYHADTRGNHQFTLHRLDAPVASGPRFGSAEQVAARLDALTALPDWCPDPATLVALDLRGWDHLGDQVVIHAETPPTIGQWTPA